MSGPLYGTSGTYRATSGSTASFAVPSSVASGDIIIVAFYLDTQAATVTAMPSGFAHLGGSPVTAAAPFNHSLIVAGKRATGADAGTYDFTLSSSQYHEGQAHRFTGAITSGAFLDTPSGTATDATSSTTTPAVSMTTAGADRLVIHCATCWAGGTWTPPTGYTKRQQGGVGLSTLSDIAQAAAGSTGSVTATISNSDKRAAWIGALIPAPPAGATPDGVAVSVGLGQPTASASLTAAPSGVAVPVSLGQPQASLLTAAPTGQGVAVALGQPTVGYSLAAAPTGIAVPVHLGTQSTLPPSATSAGGPVVRATNRRQAVHATNRRG